MGFWKRYFAAVERVFYVTAICLLVHVLHRAALHGEDISPSEYEYYGVLLGVVVVGCACLLLVSYGILALAASCVRLIRGGQAIEIGDDHDPQA